MKKSHGNPTTIHFVNLLIIVDIRRRMTADRKRSYQHWHEMLVVTVRKAVSS